MHRSITSSIVFSCYLAFSLSVACAATPVASYSFDETSGSAIDMSGNSNSLTLNGATRVAGKYGKGVSFAIGEKVTRIVSPQTALSGSLTIEAWIKPGMLPSSAKPLVVKSTRASSNYTLSLEGNKLLWTWGGGSYYHYSTGLIQSNVWQHVAVTYDSVTQRVIFYVNGNKSGEDIEKLAPFAITGPLYIGSSDTPEFFDGIIDDVRIYNTALSQSEIKTDMALPVGSTGSGVTTPVTQLPSEVPPINLGAAPTNISLPVISGNFAVGSQLRVSDGTWSNSPQTFTYQVLRNGVPISTVSTNVYTVVSQDMSSTITWKVTAANSIGSASVTTTPFGPPSVIVDPPSDILPPTSVGSITAIISNMTPNSWKALPNTKMKDVCPAPYNYWKCEAVLSAWGGGVFDSKKNRMLVFGGGHGDSWYNNIFSFDVSAMKWSRLTEMPKDVTGTTYPPHWYDMRPERCGFMPKKTMTVTPDLVDGNYFFASKCFVEPILSQLDFQQPRSAHTYGELFMDTFGDRFCSLASSYWPSAQTGSQVVHCFNFKNGLWEKAKDRPLNVGAGRGSTALDSQGNVWSLSGAGGYLGKYTPSTNSWTSYGYVNYESIGQSDIDRKRNHLYTAHAALSASSGTKITLRRWNLNDSTSLRASKTYTDIPATGDIPTIGDVGVHAGFVYADAQDKFFLWGNGYTVYSLDPKTMVWKKFIGTGDNPGLGQKNGTYGRFRYSPAHGVFVLVNSITTDVYIYKPSTTGTVPPTPDPLPPVTPPTDTSNPTSPLNFTANTYSSNVNLSWTASTDNVGVAGYTITRNGSLIASTVVGTSYQDVGLSSGTYTYTVTAYDAAGNKSIPSSSQTVTITTTVPPVVVPPIPSGDTITSITFTSPTTQSNSPFSVGQPFRQGDVPSGLSIISSIPNFQATVKTRWPDGSVKFAILSGRVDLVANTPLRIDLKAGTATSGAVLTELNLKSQNVNMLVGFQGIGQVELSTLIGKVATYSPTLNQFTAGKASDWIQGSEMSSWIYSSPVGTDPSLTAWFEVRLWKDGQVEILPWLENGFLKKAGVTEKIGQVTVSVSGVEKFSQNLSVYHHTRTPLVSGTAFSYWLHRDNKITFKHDTVYFQKTKLVPTYGASIASNSSILTSLITSYIPFAQSNFPNGMGSAGYHSSIGLLPAWDVAYLTSNADPRALAAVQVNAYSAGRYGIHYRDEKTNMPFKFSSYPNLVAGANSGLPSSGVSSTGDSIPTPLGKTPPSWTTSHAPSVGYLAYLLEGRYYFMEQAQFAGVTQYLKVGDTYRQKSKGILITNGGSSTTRGVGWGLRTYTHANLVTPDDSPLKLEFSTAINENINYYYNEYVAKANNPQGFAAPYSDYSAGDGIYMHSSWMEDFLTAAFGYILDVKANSSSHDVRLKELFNWKAQSIIGRLGQPGVATEYDFRDAAVYTLAVAPSDSADWATGIGPWYKNWGEIYRATKKTEAGTAQPNMLRGAYYPEGSSYWGNLQPAIAYAVTNNVPGASTAYARMTGASNWSLFKESVKASPEWSVVPSSTSIATVPPPSTPTNYCSASLPSCSGTSCSLTHNASSVNQSWVLNAGSCGFTCTNGYTGSTCLTPPAVIPPNPIPPAPTSTGSLPSWVSSLPLWQWYAIPNTALSSVEPSTRRLGITGPRSKIEAWTGATLKRSGSVYMLGAAGGHGDYAGNEVDALALNTETPKWVELEPASENANITDRTQFYLDKKPAATHTYNATQFIDSLNRMIVFSGGSLNGPFPAPPADSPYFGNKRSFSFNVTTNEWDSPDYIAQYPGDGDPTAALAVKHPITGDFYYSRSFSTGWYRWTKATNTWTKLSNVSRAPWYAGAAIDPVRNRILIVGGYSPINPMVTNLDGTSISVTFKGLGSEALKLGTGHTGVVYDEENDTYLVFHNTATSIAVYRVNASTWEVDIPTTTGSAPAPRPNGIHNSVQYVPELGGVVIANSYNGNVYFMRTSSKGSSILPVPNPIPNTTPVPVPLPTTTATVPPSSKPLPKPLPIESTVFPRTLASTMTGNDVYVLQTYLKTDPDLLFTATQNGVYGPMTVQAVKKFQVKYGVILPGATNVAGYGVFGPKTQAKFIEVFKGQ